MEAKEKTLREVGTAESPDIYFDGNTSEGYRVQVYFYESEQRITVSSFPPSEN